ncbi:ferredoxin family protein [Candidatus Comchoanobacter bicostacola]|uniref:Ferredoxin n=1 Tax=Candidatus Comchoanobacter bicostacola TaxID=2919598 RepID=A0ABY5DL18_9GAMM|nr:ferredoxin FdxA [Candidatus Comchoanobacter bicostacola]UTC24668.1 ferredoxin family protein [Candidatus Comchoanobacter bicostacola]
MAYIVSDQCINCKYTDCVEACPVDCFHEGPNMVIINPEECIDCNLCVSECPINAIYSEEDLPENQQHMKEINAKYADIWPLIDQKKDPMPDAEKWETITNKIDNLEE